MEKKAILCKGLIVTGVALIAMYWLDLERKILEFVVDDFASKNGLQVRVHNSSIHLNEAVLEQISISKDFSIAISRLSAALAFQKIPPFASFNKFKIDKFYLQVKAESLKDWFSKPVQKISAPVEKKRKIDSSTFLPARNNQNYK